MGPNPMIGVLIKGKYGHRDTQGEEDVIWYQRQRLE